MAEPIDSSGSRDEGPVRSQIVKIESDWLTVVGERLEETPGRDVDWWRIEKPDSVVVVTVLEDHLILPPPSYRPGVGRVTLDLAGGRLSPGRPVTDMAAAIVFREFALPAQTAITAVRQLNRVGWDVDSSTSNQQLFGAVVELAAGTSIDLRQIGATYPATTDGIRSLLAEVRCLQCRAVLLAWRESITPTDLAVTA